MAPHYDSDLDVLGWDPVTVVQEWPFIVYPKERYLDAGCGTGALLSHFQGAGRTLAAMDLSQAMLQRAKRRHNLKQVQFEQGNAQEVWPFPSSSFDKVTALAMLEFVEHLDASLDEMLRVMVPGARALFSVEDTTDWEGTIRGNYELRYDEFPLWRRSFEDIDLCLPPNATIIQHKRLRGYRVMELGFTTAYHVVEIAKDHA